MSDLTQRAQGMLLGKALGDALGAPVEGLDAGRIAAMPGLVKGLLNPVRMGPYTDDTQLALVIADTLIQTETFSPDYFVGLCVRMAAADETLPFGAFRGTGVNFRATVARWKAGTPWNRSGSATAGNGAAMRVAPIGLFYAHNPERLIRAACESAICTHLNPTGVLAAISIAQAVALCAGLSPADFRTRDFIEALNAGAGRALAILQGEYAPYLLSVPKADDPWLVGLARLDFLVGLEDTELAETIRANAAASSAFPLMGAGDPYAPASVLLALAMALKYAHDPVEALGRVIACGGDTDTTAAMTGAVVGALHGPEGWPVAWRTGLAAAPRLGAIAAQLARVSQGEPPTEALPDLVKSELALTRQALDAGAR